MRKNKKVYLIYLALGFLSDSEQTATPIDEDNLYEC